MLGVCVALVLALCLKWHTLRPIPGAKTESRSVELRYSITQKYRNGPGVVQFDRSIQLTFPGDSTMSPGSLVKMTGQMHNSEIEIATRLARDIKFPQ
jgi:hypothetical protein